MAQNTFFARSFNAAKTNNSSGYNLAQWNFEVNNDLNIVKNNSQIISIVRRRCGGLFKCTDCGHRWTKKSHSTILFQCDKFQRTIECKLFGHNCLECHSNPTYHIANYNSKEIEDTIEFLRKKLLRKLHPDMRLHEESRGPREFHRRTILHEESKGPRKFHRGTILHEESKGLREFHRGIILHEESKGPREFHRDIILHEESRRPREFHRQYGPVQQYYNVDFADYCESCRCGDYCRVHGRN